MGSCTAVIGWDRKSLQLARRSLSPRACLERTVAWSTNPGTWPSPLHNECLILFRISITFSFNINFSAIFITSYLFIINGSYVHMYYLRLAISGTYVSYVYHRLSHRSFIIGLAVNWYQFVVTPTQSNKTLTQNLQFFCIHSVYNTPI